MSVATPSVATASVATPTFTASTGTRRRTGSLPRTTVAVGLAASAATVAGAAAMHAAGVPLTVQGEMIPLAAFAQLTFLGAVIGGLLLAVLNRRSRSPHRRFLQATVALTALSCLPSVAWPPDAATKATLVGLHLLAAAIIVPVLARNTSH